MGFELVAILLSLALFGIPLLAWIILRRITAADKMQKNSEELQALENSLSLMIKELQDSVQKALSDMEESADNLNQAIEKADDRLRQLQYYLEFGDELKPLIKAIDETAEPDEGDKEPPQASESAMLKEPLAKEGSIAQARRAIEAERARARQASKHKEVHELSCKGWSAAQIARHTGMSTDEVQLIVNLMEIGALESRVEPSAPSPNPAASPTQKRQSI